MICIIALISLRGRESGPADLKNMSAVIPTSYSVNSFSRQPIPPRNQATKIELVLKEHIFDSKTGQRKRGFSPTALTPLILVSSTDELSGDLSLRDYVRNSLENVYKYLRLGKSSLIKTNFITNYFQNRSSDCRASNQRP